MSNLGRQLEKLAEQLEDRPDPWFNQPRGWLRKPDFKRDAQLRSTLAKGSGRGMFDSFLPGNTYNRRYFVLDAEKRMLWYYLDDQTGEVKGEVDLREIIAVDASHVHDAPSHSLDLISPERHYTVTAETQQDMLRWAYAISLLLPSKAASSQAATDKARALATQAPLQLSKAPTGGDKWHRYDVVFDTEGPLYLNVMGSANRDHTGKLLNSWIIVTSFELTSDGKPGRSEKSGLIAVKDYIVGVNGVDLTTATFNEAMATIGSAAWPKTLHFLRDNEAAKSVSRIESWATVFYPALNRRRRRYIEVKNDLVVFYKPAPGGSASGARDAYFPLSNIVALRPLVDYGAAAAERYTLRIECRAGATVEHVGADDASVGGSLVHLLELCFPKESHMNAWRSILVSPLSAASSAAAGAAAIEVFPVEMAAAGEATQAISDVLAVKSALTGRFAQREFTLDAGVLAWRRRGGGGGGGGGQGSGASRSMFLASSAVCSLVSVRAVCLPESAGEQYRFQLHLSTTEQAVTMGVADEAALERWLAKVREVVAACPAVVVRPGLVVPDRVERVGVASGGDEGSKADDEFFDVIDSSHEEGQNDILQGYLYKLKDGFLPKGLLQANYSKRWLVLRDGLLSCYRSHIEVPAGVMPLEIVDLRSVYEVREATGANAPENALEVVTPGKTYVLAADDDDTAALWLDALGDYLEARDQAVAVAKSSSSSSSASTHAATSSADRAAAIKASILFSGGLTMKSVNLITGLVTWRDRHVVITRGACSYYGDASDVFDVSKDCIGEINLAGIGSLESSSEPRCARGCAFNLEAHVNKGGDSRGVRVFIFEARTPELAKQWMEEICKASGKFVLRGSPQGGYHSERADQGAAKSAWLLTGTQTGGTSTAVDAEGAGAGAGVGMGAGAERRRSVILDNKGRGGGRGRGEAFAAGSAVGARRASVKMDAPPVLEAAPEVRATRRSSGSGREGGRRPSGPPPVVIANGGL